MKIIYLERLMKYSKDEAFVMLGNLGASRWDTNPPEEGRIRWYNSSDKLIAEADYRVILSVGPGAMYTMGYAIRLYTELGIPYTKQVDQLPDIVSEVKSDAEVWKRAEEVGRLTDAEFTYQCGNLLVAVYNFHVSKSID
jgi:hypothetical protein